MGRLMAAFYDRLMQGSEEACLQDWRAELLRDLRGDVLEIGAGTGASVPLYSAAVTRLILAEPDRHMRQRLASKCGHNDGRVVISGSGAEALELPDASVDAVVSSLVLCSVTDLQLAIAEVRRVLRPGGRFVFLEHVAAHDRPDRLRWQRRVEPVWKRVFGNCHLTRHTEQALIDAGFTLPDITRESMRKANPLVRASIRGVAIAPS